LDEKTFPKFCASLFKAVFRLLTHDNKPATISIRQLFNNSAATLSGNENLLDEKITIQPNVNVSECPQMDEEGNYQIKNIKEIRLLNRLQPYDFSEGKHIIRVSRRALTVYLFVPPNFAIRFKWSDYLSSLQPIRKAKSDTDKTVYITPQLIRNEIEKMRTVPGTEEFIFVLISPKELAPNTLKMEIEKRRILLVCGTENLKKFSRAFLSGFTFAQVYLIIVIYIASISTSLQITDIIFYFVSVRCRIPKKSKQRSICLGVLNKYYRTLLF
jgi:hypothetical protein